jgi:hypothetical protein
MRSTRPSVAQLVTRIAEVEASLPRGSSVDPIGASRQVARDTERMRGVLTGAAIDAAELERVGRVASAEREELLAQARERAIAGSPAAAKRLAELSPGFVVLADPVEPWQPGSFIVEDALFIRSWPEAGSLREFATGDVGNWAEYRLDVSGDAVASSDEARLSFYFLWQNPRDEDVYAHISARMAVNAHMTAHADWSGVAAWFFGDSFARAQVHGRLSLWPLWTDSTPAVMADVPIGQISATGGFFGGGDDTSLAASDLLSGGAFGIPAGRFVMIEVSLVTTWSAMDGSIDLDAESGSFRVDCPAAIVVLPSSGTAS